MTKLSTGYYTTLGLIALAGVSSELYARPMVIEPFHLSTTIGTGEPERSIGILEQLNPRLSVDDLVAINVAIIKASRAFSISPATILGIIAIESRARMYNRRGGVLTSRAGAKGIMQVLPSTGREMGYNVDTLEGNIMAGTKYIRHLLDRYRGDMRRALMAYNAGPGNIAKWTKPPYSVRNYADKVLNNRKEYRG